MIYDNDTEYTTEDLDFLRGFMRFSAFLCILYNKKMSFPNIFILILKDTKFRNLYKKMIDVELDEEAFRLFLNYDTTIAKSKLIKRYIGEYTRDRDNRVRKKGIQSIPKLKGKKRKQAIPIKAGFQ